MSYRLGNVHLEIDPESMEIANSGANELLRGSYREPYTIPEKV